MDVDFSALRHASEQTGVARCHGPVTQNKFLQVLGIVPRLEQMLRNMDDGKLLIALCFVSDPTK